MTSQAVLDSNGTCSGRFLEHVLPREARYPEMPRKEHLHDSRASGGRRERRSHAEESVE